MKYRYNSQNYNIFVGLIYKMDMDGFEDPNHLPLAIPLIPSQVRKTKQY